MDKMKKPLDQVLCECSYHPDDKDITGGSTPPSHKGELKKLGSHEFCTFCLNKKTKKQLCPVYNQILEQYPLDEDQAVSEVSPPKGPKEGVYQMSSKPRGICLIISNKNFGGPRDRHGTERDVESLSRVFSCLGFKVLLCVDKTAQQMKEVLEHISKLKRTPNVEPHPNPLLQCGLYKYSGGGDFSPLEKLPHHGNAFVCCLMSHGGQTGVCGVDDVQLPIDQILSQLNGENCSALIGKPKMFFIQACRGTAEMQGMLTDLSGGSYLPETQRCFIPSEADFLVVRSTVQNYVSYRNAKLGSTFIQTLCSQLISDCPRGEDILTILTKVNDKVSQRGHPTKKQVSEGSFTLRKRLVFSD